MSPIRLVVQDSEMPIQQNQEMAQSIPDPFPCSRVESGNDTNVDTDNAYPLHMALFPYIKMVKINGG